MPLQRCILWLGFLVLACTCTNAHAHPFQDGLAGHKIRVVVDAHEVRADLLVEEPIPWVLKDLRAFLVDVPSPSAEDQERYTSRRLTEFEDGFQLYVDGVRVGWRREPWEGSNGVGDRQFVVFGLTLVADLPESSDSIDLHLLDINHEDKKVAQLVDVWSHPSVDVRGCSLWRDANGAPKENRAGQWAAGDSMREVRIAVVQNGWFQTWWHQLGRRVRGIPLGPQPMGPNGEAGPNHEVGIAVILLVAGVLGVFARRRSRKTFSADVDSRRDVQ